MKTAVHYLLVVTFCLLLPAICAAQESDNSHVIAGLVVELRSGTAGVPVCLCDAATGMPVDKTTYRPLKWNRRQAENPIDSMAIVVSDAKGRFRFSDVPDGRYRLIAERWMGGFEGLSDTSSTVIQLMGTAEDIVVPRPKGHYEAQVAIVPSGSRIVKFDQQVPNSSTILFLSTAAPEFDPVLGLHAMGTEFLNHLVAVNRMPLGKTTVMGASDANLYAFFFAPDNSPGFAMVEVPADSGELVRVPATPFVAGWSDGKKTPPKELADLADYLEQQSLNVDEILAIPAISSATYLQYRERMKELYQRLPESIPLSEERSARVGDLLAVRAYQRFQTMRK